MFGRRPWFWLAGLLILVTLPARFARVWDSLWLDEAWVANSVLQPSLHDVFFNKAWAQSTPPLFLLLERWIAALFGASEPVLRVLPVTAGLIGLVLTASVLRKWLSTPAALLALTLLCGNYYIGKYSQQVKQYGTDFMVSALLLVLVSRYIENRSNQRLATLLSAGVVGLFLSYTAAFWLVSLVLTACLPETLGVSREPQWFRRVRWGRMFTGAGVLGCSFLLVDLIFVRPNRTAALVQNFRTSYLDVHHPVASLQGLLSTLGMIMIARSGFVAEVIGAAALALAIGVSIDALLRLRDGAPGEQRRLMIVLSGTLPLVSVLMAGTLGLYPVLDYPRMLLFVVPSLALLLGAACEILLTWSGPMQAHPTAVRMGVGAACLLAVLASQIIFFRYPRPAEDNRGAIGLIQSQMNSRDLLFVHPGMFEQLKYYRPRMHFYPAEMYLGNTQWPCCATGDLEQAASPQLKDFDNDLLEAGRKAHGRGLWLLFPAGTEGHWSAEYRASFDQTARILARSGCNRVARKVFDQTLVEHYICQ